MAIDSSSAPITREQALRAIEACSSMQELFELATPLIGWERERWGDDVRLSSGASRFWRSCVFPVVAQRSVPMSRERSVDGAELTRQGLEVAKKIAALLLGPLSQPAGELLKFGAPEESNPLTPVIAAIKQALAEHVGKVAQTARKAAHPLVTHPDLNALYPGLAGNSAMIELGKSARMWEMGGSGWSWPQERSKMEVERERAGARFEELGAGLGSLSEELTELQQLGGFSVVSAGPQGDWRVAASEARRLAGACAALASALGAPSSRVAGLGGMKISVNCEARGGSVARFLPSVFSMEFSYGSRSLGHEWTHALDHACAKGEGELAQSAHRARQSALSAIRNAPQDPLAQMLSPVKPVRESDKLEVFKAFLKKDGQLPAESEEWLNQRASELLREQLRLLESHEWSVEKALPSCVKALEAVEALRGERAQPINQDVLAWELAEYEQQSADARREKELLDQGVNRMLVASLVIDERKIKQGESAEPYYSNEMELLARVGEVFFAQRSQSAELVKRHWDPLERKFPVYPHGRERAPMARAYGIWIKACEPYIRLLCEGDAPKPVEEQLLLMAPLKKSLALRRGQKKGGDARRAKAAPSSGG